jgi:hypothetical protein
MDTQTVGNVFGRERNTSHMILIRGLLMIGISLSSALGACSPVKPAASTQTSAPVGIPAAADTPTVVPAATSTSVPATVAPSLTATLPLSAVVQQALKDAFNCLTNNLIYASNITLTNYCPGYWAGSTSNIYTLDGVVIRKELVPNLSPLSNIRWKFSSLTDVQKDERLSTTVNMVYTATLSTTLTADANLKCPSGTPAPFQSSVIIPIKGVARISVYNYLNQAQETIQIESWTIKGNPLEDYCTALH